jgi:photosystem II stability/assembly factor-like uncharacterized protein
VTVSTAERRGARRSTAVRAAAPPIWREPENAERRSTRASGSFSAARGRFAAAAHGTGIYRSTDGGRTWTQLTGHGLPSGITGRIGLAVAPSDPDRVYALIESGRGILWRPDDNGEN